MPVPAIELSGLSHTYARAKGGRAVPALQDVALSVPEGAFVSLVGPSGCGKSTLLRVLAGLLRPTEGVALVHGRSAIATPGLTAYMPQRDLLLPWRKALQNAVLGAEIAGGLDATERARGLFERFGLAGFEDAWPSQLSGGMRQRLALLRTFLMPANVLLLDEPFGALDAITRREMQSWFQEVWMADRRTVFFVTHDIEEALVLSDRVVMMTPRPGRIAASFEVSFARPRGTELVTDAVFVAQKAETMRALSAHPARP